MPDGGNWYDLVLVELYLWEPEFWNPEEHPDLYDHSVPTA